MTDGGGLVAGARAAVVVRLRARRDELIDAIFARMWGDAFDRAGEDDAEYLAGLRATVAAALEYVLAGIERGEDESPPTPAVPAVALEQARRAARVGVPLDTVLRRYVVGSALLGEYVMEEADRGEINWNPPAPLGGREALREALRAQASGIDRLLQAITAAYTDELERASDTPSRGRKMRSARSTQEAEMRSRSSSWSDRASRRDRILEAMMEVSAERGFENTSVKLVTERAGVSTRTFYEEFDGSRECFLAVLDLGFQRAGELIAAAYARERRWQDGLLGALASLLVFLDGEPSLARVCFVESVAAGSWALERREQIAQALRLMIVEYWVARGDEPPEPVAAAGLMASVLGLIQTHLATEQPGSLIELLGPLMGLITSLYLDRQDVTREVQRGARLAREIQAEQAQRVRSHSLPADGSDLERRTREIPAMLRNPRAGRARMCVRYLAAQGRRGISPSNRQIAAGIGIANEGQISKLLIRLERGAVVSKFSHGVGRPNAWRLTPYGEELAAYFEHHEKS